MKISILQGSANGTSIYSETQNPSTNANGLISIEIGSGTTSGDFSTIDWANGPFFIKTETDPAGGTNYSITGTSQLMSVPYALHAKTAENVVGGISETDPVFGQSIAGGITKKDTAIWSNHTTITSKGIAGLGFASGAHTDSTDVANMGFVAGSGSKAAFTTTDSITSNASGDYATDDFVFGSPQMDDDGDENHDYRMFFDKSTGAFRAGFTSGANWDLVNRGNGSVAMGIDNSASGFYSTAIGFHNTASGSSSISIGQFTKALGNNSTAIGISTIASGNSSTSIGASNTASGLTSTAMGFDNTASGNFSVVIGYKNTASNVNSTAFGRLTTASGKHSTAMGHLTIASGEKSTAMGFYSPARSYGETAIGIFGTDYTPGSINSINSGDRLFVVGNGTSVNARSDAFIIFKNGDATLSGTLTQLSDIQLKSNINALDHSLQKLLKLQGVSYNWNDVKPHDMESMQTGLIAQEVEKILPELVNRGTGGYKSVNYIGLIPHLIEALKESDQKVKNLEDRLLKLERLINN